LKPEQGDGVRGKLLRQQVGQLGGQNSPAYRGRCDPGDLERDLTGIRLLACGLSKQWHIAHAVHRLVSVRKW
jgi:hypothetical protein